MQLWVPAKEVPILLYGLVCVLIDHYCCLYSYMHRIMEPNDLRFFTDGSATQYRM
jgi:hypothetical protein